MKRYRAYRANKFRLPRRIIFFCIVAVVIAVLTMILGNFLKGKLESTPRDTSDITTTEIDDKKYPSKDKSEDVSVEHDVALEKVTAGYLDLFGVIDSEGVLAVINEMKEKGFNAVSFCVTDADGKFTYASPAIEESSRLPASKELVVYSILLEAVETAKANGMRTSAVMTLTDSLSDELVVEELAKAGFDELIIRGFEDRTKLDNNTVEEIGSCVKKMRKLSGDMDISLSFVSEFFEAPSNAPYIEKIYDMVEFISIDLTSITAEEVPLLTDKIAGSINAYLLRPLLMGDDAEAAANIDIALTESFFEARQYISAPEKEEIPEGELGEGNVGEGDTSTDVVY